MSNLNVMKTLITDIELFAAALAQARVSVLLKVDDGTLQLVEYGGPIEKYSPVAVRIGGVYYAREVHVFHIREGRKD